jgi:hypothetical protein
LIDELPFVILNQGDGMKNVTDFHELYDPLKKDFDEAWEMLTGQLAYIKSETSVEESYDQKLLAGIKVEVENIRKKSSFVYPEGVPRTIKEFFPAIQSIIADIENGTFMSEPEA